jgi:hypothetical protein
MANICVSCGVNVGCGCNLKGGLCASCRSKVQTPPPPPPSQAVKTY